MRAIWLGLLGQLTYSGHHKILAKVKCWSYLTQPAYLIQVLIPISWELLFLTPLEVARLEVTWTLPKLIFH